MLQAQPNAKVLGPGAIVLGIVLLQVSAAIAKPAFDGVGVYGVVGGRFLVGAVLLLLIVRPRLRGRTRAEWTGVGIYGTTMAMMTCSFFSAIDRLPMGTTATIFYLGPFAVAVSYARRAWEIVLPVMGLAGVALVARPGGDLDLVGVGFALLAGLAIALYTVFAQRVGHTVPGLAGLALSASVAALWLLPVTVTAVPGIALHEALSIAAAGILGIVIGFGCDFTGIRLSSARVAATLYSLEPAAAAVVGAILLDQVLPLTSIVGMALVVTAGILAARTISPVDKPIPETF